MGGDGPSTQSSITLSTINIFKPDDIIFIEITSRLDFDKKGRNLPRICEAVLLAECRGHPAAVELRGPGLRFKPRNGAARPASLRPGFFLGGAKKRPREGPGRQSCSGGDQSCEDWSNLLLWHPNLRRRPTCGRKSRQRSCPLARLE